MIYDYFYYKGREKLGKRHDNILEEFEKYPELKEQIWSEMVEFIQKTRDNDYNDYWEMFQQKMDEKKELPEDPEAL